MDINLNPTYDQIHSACDHAASAMRKLDWNFDRIVGISRGGLIPAVILSHLTNTPLTPISYSSAQGNGDNKNHTNIFPEIRGEIILIVDDICDSGRTLYEITGHYTNMHNSVYSFALFYKERPVPLIIPTFRWQTIPHDSGWVVFPFERDISKLEAPGGFSKWRE